MDSDRFSYASYMLRIWRENDKALGQTGEDRSEWRASLQYPHTQEMKVFASLEALFEFLRESTAAIRSPELPTFQKVGNSGWGGKNQW